MPLGHASRPTVHYAYQTLNGAFDAIVTFLQEGSRFREQPLRQKLEQAVYTADTRVEPR